MNPSYVEDQPDTVPTDHGDLGPSKAEYRRAGEAATEMGADVAEPDGSGIVWAVLIGLGLLLASAVVGVTGRAMGVW